jgi:hypothetical protein
MNKTKYTNTKLKRIWAWLTPEQHAAIKVIAAQKGVFMEEWCKQAVLEKLERENKVIPFNGDKQ